MKKLFSIIMASAMGLMALTAVPASTFAATGYTAAQVATHNVASNCWLIIAGQVYDVTTFIPIHPGGSAIVAYCGSDATTIFDAIHNAAGVAALPPYLIGSLITQLTAPTNLAATPTQTTAALTWTASSGGLAPLTYSILRNGTVVGTSATALFTDTGLTASTTYSYVIQATDSEAPTANTASSAALSVTTLAVPVPTALTAPSNLAASVTQTSVALSWTASTGGTSPISYSIIRGGVTVGTSSVASFTDTGLTASTTYSYVVKATDSATPTPATASSAALSVTTLGAGTSADTISPTVSITAPLNKAKVSGIVTITVNAADNVGVTKVVLYIDGKQVTTSSVAPFSFTWNTANSSRRTHSIFVKAYDAAGNVGTSATVRVKVQKGTGHHNNGDDQNENGQGDNNNNGNNNNHSDN